MLVDEPCAEASNGGENWCFARALYLVIDGCACRGYYISAEVTLANWGFNVISSARIVRARPTLPGCIN